LKGFPDVDRSLTHASAKGNAWSGLFFVKPRCSAGAALAPGVQPGEEKGPDPHDCEQQHRQAVQTAERRLLAAEFSPAIMRNRWQSAGDFLFASNGEKTNGKPLRRR